MIFVLAIVAAVILFLCLLGAFLKVEDISFRNALRNGSFPYVHVETDGTVRELYDDEKEYLQEEFSPMDGARPYIKYNYRQLTPDKKIHGYLKRSRVPRKIAIKPIDPNNKQSHV